MLMIPTMHRISGERLPGVLHVASRTVGTHEIGRASCRERVSVRVEVWGGGG